MDWILLAILACQMVLFGVLIWDQVSWIWRLTPDQLEWELIRRG
jgi:hypothetical protein